MLPPGGDLLTEGNYTIGIFDGMGKARGRAPIEQLSGREVSYLTVAGESADRLYVRLLDTETGLDIDLGQTVPFEANRHLGDPANPFLIEVSDSVCQQLTTAHLTPEPGFKVFPTLITQYFYLDYKAVAQDDNAWVRVIDNRGTLVYHASLQVLKGNNQQRIDLSGNELTPGLYTVELYANGQLLTQKLVKAD